MRESKKGRFLHFTEASLFYLIIVFLILLTIPNLNSIIKKRQDLFIILAFPRHLLCAVLAHADAVAVAATPDGKGADIFFFIPGRLID